MEDCVLCEVGVINPTFIYNFDYWTLLANYMQPTLGSVLLVLNRHSERGLFGLTHDEEYNYWSSVRKIESSLRKSFNPDMINHLMLANVVKHTHYHIVPRYSSERNFANNVFVDGTYGHTPKLTQERKPQDIIDAVKKKVLEDLIKP